MPEVVIRGGHRSPIRTGWLPRGAHPSWRIFSRQDILLFASSNFEFDFSESALDQILLAFDSLTDDLRQCAFGIKRLLDEKEQ